ncbi:MAG TPA: TatD family hydrolase [Acidimicrobiia bacterium]
MAAWVDSHCHLFLADEAAGTLIGRARQAGVAWVMCPGTDLGSSLEARSLAAEHAGFVLWSAGLHPHDAASWARQGGRISSLAVEAAAVGECGLDFYRDLSPRQDQVAAFRAQLELAGRLAKPVVVHCRDAFSEVHAELERAQLGERAVLHCWTGGPKWTKRFADLGVTFSFAGPVAFETGDTVRRGAAEAPPERTMVETDTPYLSPPPHRGEPNEPARVALVGAALADVWGVDVDEVAALTSETATRVFGGPR